MSNPDRLSGLQSVSDGQQAGKNDIHFQTNPLDQSSGQALVSEQISIRYAYTTLAERRQINIKCCVCRMELRRCQRFITLFLFTGV